MPVLLLLKGLPGCGKSSIACQLSQHLGWTLAVKDDVRDGLVILQDTVPLERLNALSYDVLMRFITRYCSE